MDAWSMTCQHDTASVFVIILLFMPYNHAKNVVLTYLVHDGLVFDLLGAVGKLECADRFIAEGGCDGTDNCRPRVASEGGL